MRLWTFGKHRSGFAALAVTSFLVLAISSSAEAGNPSVRQQIRNAQKLLDKKEPYRADYEKAERLWRPLAKRGYPVAQYGLAEAIIKPCCTQNRCIEARELYRQAAQQGYAPAQQKLGEELAYAPNWKRSPEANDHSPEGGRYCANLGIPYDLNQAISWFRKAANQGYSEAQLKLAQSYLEGVGVKQSPSTALYWYLKAAIRNNAEAQYHIASFYAKGSNGLPKSIPKALYWYRKAAALGFPEAQEELGRRYGYGDGLKQNLDKAIYWIRKCKAQTLFRELWEKYPDKWATLLFPNAISELSYDGKGRNLRMSGHLIHLTPVRYSVGSAGVASDMTVCGLIIKRAGRKTQGIMTYGAWNRIVEMDTCEKFVGAGLMPPLEGASRIGLIYYASSNSSQGGAETGPMVLIEDQKTRKWRIDEVSSEAVTGFVTIDGEDKMIETIDDMRKFLSQPTAPVPASPAE